MDLHDFFDTATHTMTAALDGQGVDALDAASGASEWTGRQVLEHVLAVNGQARAMTTGVDVRADGSTPDQLDAADPAGSYARSAAATASAFAAPELQSRLLGTPMGLFPGRVVFSVTAIENLVHAWDLSVATGRTLQFDATAVGYAFRAIEDMPDVWHNFWFWGAYARPLPTAADASATEQLLALLGRDIHEPARSGARAEGDDPRNNLRPTARPTGGAWDDQPAATTL